MLTIPPETAYSDVELAWIESEPAGRFPLDQSSVWGQARKVFADYLQASVVDKLSDFEDARQIAFCPEEEIHNWEIMLGMPVNDAAPIDYRRALVGLRAYRGPFTRTQRANVVKTFISLVLFGKTITFTTGGVTFPDGAGSDDGLFFRDESTAGIDALYSVVEDIPNFTYNVKLDASLSGNIDEDALTRELERLTTAPITFTITYDL